MQIAFNRVEYSNWDDTLINRVRVDVGVGNVGGTKLFANVFIVEHLSSNSRLNIVKINQIFLFDLNPTFLRFVFL